MIEEVTPAETFEDVVDRMESGGLNIRATYWSQDESPFFVEIADDPRLRKVLGVRQISDGSILVTVEA